MLRLHRHYLIAAATALIVGFCLFAYVGTAKPQHLWHWMDILSEGGTAFMAGVWLLITLSSRPKGLVTRLLGAALAFIMLGAWVDCLDEFFMLPKGMIWDNWLEAIFQLGGMLILTAGLYYWRQEQFILNEHLQKRERLFRDHRAFDRLTQISNADYLRTQIRLEQELHPNEPCAVVLFDINQFHLINREHGKHEGDRALQAVCHMLLLNVRNDDLLCRYAGDRFALLMPRTNEIDAKELAEHLCFMVQHMKHQVKASALQISMRHVAAIVNADTDDILAKLSRSVETQFQPDVVSGMQAA